MSCWQSFASQFSKRMFSVDGYPLEYSFTSPYISPMTFAIFRIVMGFYLLSWVIVAGVEQDNEGKLFMYLTYLSALVISVWFLYSGVLTYLFAKDPEVITSGKGKVAAEWQYRTNNLALIGPFLIVVVYWGVIYTGGHVTAYNVHVHGINFVQTLADFFLSRTEFSIGNAWVTYIYGITYLIFTVIFYGAGGNNTMGKPYVYTFLDYGNNPTTAVIYVFGIVLIVFPLLNVLMWLIGYMRNAMCRGGANNGAHMLNVDQKDNPESDVELQTMSSVTDTITP
eukprot:GFYU01001473.1.p1 GENE.GFYU01001473.1~~GFYU01001473.1.p1  ORF type:complete len:281 (+),score=89.46 GFYU01001473.1:90-932(+)